MSKLQPFMSKEQRRASGRAEMHLKSEKPDWDKFRAYAKRTSFVKAVAADPRSDDKLIRHTDQMNRLQTGKPIAKVKGDSGQTYEIVRKRGGGLACTCNDWRYRRSVAPDGQQTCKHIERFKSTEKAAAAAFFDELEKLGYAPFAAGAVPGAIAGYAAGRKAGLGPRGSIAAGVAGATGLGVGAEIAVRDHRRYRQAKDTHREVGGWLVDKDIPILKPGKTNEETLRAIQQGVAKAKSTWSHPQVAIPVDKMPRLEDMGFKKTRIAIPLPGELPFTPSWRKGKIHAHKQGPYYITHIDKHDPFGGGVKHVATHWAQDGLKALHRVGKGDSRIAVMRKRTG